MKTTVEIPDALFRRAKAVALERGLSLRALFVAGLEKELQAVPKVPKWRKLVGKLPPDAVADLNRFFAANPSPIDAELWETPPPESKRRPRVS